VVVQLVELRRLSERRPEVTNMKLSALLPAALACVGCLQLDDAAPIKLETHVDDWRDEVVYQVLVDRFANGDTGNDYNVDLSSLGKWHGGDWKGLEDHLDYIQGLGATTIWISPVVKNVDTDAGFDAYHGYWMQDLTQTNPHFGDLPALRHLVAAAHDKKMRVILDIVTNHFGQLFYYDINKNGQPDNNVFGYGCDKFRDPNDPMNPYTNPSDPNAQCLVKNGQSGIIHVSEYDPDFYAPGAVEAYTSLGNSGPAPIIFNDDPATNHMPPMPELFQDVTTFNRRGRTVDYSVGDQLLHGDFPGGLKDVNTTRCDVKAAMVDAYARWVELVDLDGFRIDTVKHVEPEFWRYFTQKVRQRLAKQGKKNFLMFGEAFDGDDALVGSFTKGGDVPELPAGPQSVLGTPSLDAENKRCVTDGVSLNADMLDSMFYFPQYYGVIAGVFRDAGSTSQIQSLWGQRGANWGGTPTKDGVGIAPSTLPVNFLDNHDVGRFLFREFFHTDGAALAAGQLTQAQFDGTRQAKLKNALVFVLTEQGLPCLYYGTEQGLEGGNDPANREDLWESGYATQPATDASTGRTYGSFYGWIAKLTKLRKAHKALTHGDQKVVWSTDHTGMEGDAGLLAFERAGGDAGDGYALVIINTSSQHASAPIDGTTTMKVSAAAGTMLVDVLADKPASYAVAADGSVTIQLPALSAAVLVPAAQASGN
jgi:glycosidase